MFVQNADNLSAPSAPPPAKKSRQARTTHKPTETNTVSFPPASFPFYVGRTAPSYLTIIGYGDALAPLSAKYKTISSIPGVKILSGFVKKATRKGVAQFKLTTAIELLSSVSWGAIKSHLLAHFENEILQKNMIYWFSAEPSFQHYEGPQKY